MRPNYSGDPDYASTATVRVNKDGKEEIYDSGYFLNGDTSISGEIADGIFRLGDTQTVNSKVARGEFDKNGAIEQYRIGIEEATKTAKKEMTIDENGNISLAEMDSLIQENDEEER